MSLQALSKLDVYVLKAREERVIISSLALCPHPEKIEKIVLHTAGMLTAEERLKVESSLLSDARLCLLRYVQEKHYLPRLVLSALLFLALYFFFSIVVRDPIPMADELLLSFCGSLLLWFYLLKKDKAFILSSELIFPLSARIKDASEESTAIVDQIEAYLYELKQRYSPVELCDILAKRKINALPPFSQELPEVFCYYGEKIDRRSSYFLSRILKNQKANANLAGALLQAHQRGEISLLLLCLLALKK